MLRATFLLRLSSALVCWLLEMSGGLLFCPVAEAVRLKDLAQVEGFRTNQLFGYGLVVGLAS